jgi:hypothetical protein
LLAGSCVSLADVGSFRTTAGHCFSVRAPTALRAASTS